MANDEPQPVVLSYHPSQTVFQPDIFKGKVAFVTGGGSGICKQITEQLMRHGANTTIVGRKADRLQAAASELESKVGNGTKCLATPGDVRSFDSLQAAVQKTVQTYGRLDFVVCGAAGNFMVPMDGLKPKGFQTVLEIDLIGTFNTIKATVDELKKTHGAYVHISATLHYNGLPWQSAPSAAKAGVDALSNSVAVEYGPFGIRSNIIAPGPIGNTEGTARLSPEGTEDIVAARVPLQRQGNTGDVANMAVFLFSDAASWVSGGKFTVDGAAWHNGGFWLPYPDSQLDPKSLSSLFKGSRL